MPAPSPEIAEQARQDVEGAARAAVLAFRMRDTKGTMKALRDLTGKVARLDQVADGSPGYATAQ